MKLACPQCRRPFDPTQLNVQADVAMCVPCNEVFAISTLVDGSHVTEGFDIHQPPKGAWFEELPGGWQLGASTRSAAAFFLVPFMCVWAGFSLGGIYGSQIVAGEFNLFLSVFGIPFVLATILFGTLAAMTVCGKTVIWTEHDAGWVFVGIGSWGWTREFDWSSVQSVDTDFLGYHYSGSNGQLITLTGQSELRFGSPIPRARQYYLLQALRVLLESRSR